MVDYSVDDTFDLHFTDDDNFAEVSGREEFEENLIIELDHRLGEIVGGYRTSDTVAEKAEMLANRVAKQFDVVNQIERINAFEPIDQPDTIALEVFYITGDSFEETL